MSEERSYFYKFHNGKTLDEKLLDDLIYNPARDDVDKAKTPEEIADLYVVLYNDLYIGANNCWDKRLLDKLDGAFQRLRSKIVSNFIESQGYEYRSNRFTGEPRIFPKEVTSKWKEPCMWE